MSGAADIAAAFAAVGGNLATPMAAASRKALRPMLKQAKATAPVDSGDLKKSLTVKRSRRVPKGVVEHQVGPSKDYVGADGSKPIRYAHLTEFGKADGSQKGTRWMSRAFEETKAETIEEFGKAMGPEIEKAAARRAKRRAK